MRSFLKERTPMKFSGLGFTLVEMIAAMTIMLLLTTIALPVAGIVVRREKEQELREDLRMMRNAIDRYKDFADRGMIPVEMDTYGYPPTLETLVKGVPLKGSKDRYKFLRKIPVDPMTGNTDWGLRSMQDDPDSGSWGGQDVFDVYSKSQGVGLNGVPYADW
ncbi:MAG TPA: type II secretion system protein [Terriglobia bacterium]|jgi:general secretion pathway protein G|nr:type II secretion system protein [Terriglobia bacterium]